MTDLYPDTTRFVYVGVENVQYTEAATMYYAHTTNEPAHTLQNGLIIPQENTGTRTKDNGQRRGKRSSSIRIQSYVRLDEVGLWLESAIGQGTTTPAVDTTHQSVALTGSPTGGTFTLEYFGNVTTPLAFNATAPTVQAALEALPDIVPGDVAVTGSAGGPWAVVFLANLALNRYVLVGNGTLLTGGTSPSVSVTPLAVTGAYIRTYKGGVVRGMPLSLKFFNGLYWRRMLGARVNTLNAQVFGAQLAMLDMEIVGRASQKIDPPTPLMEDLTYPQIDVPMQSVAFNGLIDADMDRMSFQINNNLTPRNTMDGTTSVRRFRVGDFALAFDGQADYPAYAGSLYEAMENNYPIGAMDMTMVDDQMTFGAPTIHPFLRSILPKPLLGDTAEGSDAGELVQDIKGRAEYSPVDAATAIFQLGNDKAAAYYQAT